MKRPDDLSADDIWAALGEYAYDVVMCEGVLFSEDKLVVMAFKQYMDENHVEPETVLPKNYYTWNLTPHGKPLDFSAMASSVGIARNIVSRDVKESRACDGALVECLTAVSEKPDLIILSGM